MSRRGPAGIGSPGGSGPPPIKDSGTSMVAVSRKLTDGETDRFPIPSRVPALAVRVSVSANPREYVSCSARSIVLRAKLVRALQVMLLKAFAVALGAGNSVRDENERLTLGRSHSIRSSDRYSARLADSDSDPQSKRRSSPALDSMERVDSRGSRE